MHLTLNFSGEPRAVQSMRVCQIGGFLRKYQPKAVTDWKNWIRLQAIDQLPEGWQVIADTPISVDCEFRFTPPKSMRASLRRDLMAGSAVAWKTTRPDLGDNLRKGVLDALTGIVWRDDALIARDSGRKIYAREPGIKIMIQTIAESETI